MKKPINFLCFLLLTLCLSAQAPDNNIFRPIDVFELEHVSDPRISPDGEHIIYVRNYKDVMTDANLSNLWIIDFGGRDHQPLTTGKNRDRHPRWSADGNTIAYLSDKNGSTQIYKLWMKSGAEARLTNLTESPNNLTISPDGRWIAFTMFVEDKTRDEAYSLPDKPAGAKWAKEPMLIDEMYYRADGSGYLKKGYDQVFLLSTEGGTPRQLTSGPFHHDNKLSWFADSKSLAFSANRHVNWEYDPRNTEVYRLSISDGKIQALTDRQGPDTQPVVSASGKYIAYRGFDDTYQGYQVQKLYLMNADGSDQKVISVDLDRDVANLQWSGDDRGIYFQYDDLGDTKLAYIDLDGHITDLAHNVGGLSLGRPYSGGTFSVSQNDRFAFTLTSSHHPADLASGGNSGTEINRLTRLNDDLFAFKSLGSVEELWYESAFDGRKIQGWICKPPDFNPKMKYPLLLEIHGGPFANYGNRFSAEVQLYAAAGYVVLFTNPRGSTSYGEEFGNLIHHNYPGEDYNDLMSGVDAMVETGYIDKDQLYVTGGSGGGVLTSWIVGKTNRFKAAVVAKPVINWYSFVLNADVPGFFYKYWFPGPPWEHTEHYMKRSPISYVGNVTTPTMLLTGEEDFRTPISETEQFYTGLKLNRVETAMVRVPGASHGIARKPSQLIAKVNYITGWFEKYRKSKS